MRELKLLAIIIATLMLVLIGRVPAAPAHDVVEAAPPEENAFAAPRQTESFRLWDGRAPRRG